MRIVVTPDGVTEKYFRDKLMATLVRTTGDIEVWHNVRIFVLNDFIEVDVYEAKTKDSEGHEISSTGKSPGLALRNLRRYIRHLEGGGDPFK